MRVLTLDEAATLSTLTRRSIERHLSQGTGPATVSLGLRRIGILDVDLEAWLRARRNPAPGEHSSAPAVPKADEPQTPLDVKPGGKFRRKVPAHT
jgi:predicted DNA-binding transcriptional regulator AlpA